MAGHTTSTVSDHYHRSRSGSDSIESIRAEFNTILLSWLHLGFRYILSSKPRNTPSRIYLSLSQQRQKSIKYMERKSSSFSHSRCCHYSRQGIMYFFILFWHSISRGYTRLSQEGRKKMSKNNRKEDFRNDFLCRNGKRCLKASERSPWSWVQPFLGSLATQVVTFIPRIFDLLVNGTQHKRKKLR